MEHEIPTVVEEELSPTEQARLAGLRDLAEKHLARAGRRELPESQVKDAPYDLSTAPAPIQVLAKTVEALAIEEVRSEVMLQFPVDSAHGPGFPTYKDDSTLWAWTEEEDRRARNKLVGYVCGLALGVTKLEKEPLTDVVKAATKIGIDLARKQVAQRRAERLGLGVQLQRQNRLRAKAKAAKASRKKNRG